MSLAGQNRSEVHRKEILNVRQAESDCFRRRRCADSGFAATRNRTRGCEEDYGPRQGVIGGSGFVQASDDDRVDHETPGLGTSEASREKVPSK